MASSHQSTDSKRSDLMPRQLTSPTPGRPIRLTRVRQNNLKAISVEFPAKKISVVTGVSGSGKSSLVFDTLYAEGQRRYVESLSTYTRQFLEKMPKPDLDGVENIPPAIALEQKNHIVNSRSTVGTQTEIVDYLRLLFAKIGKTQCLQCGSEVKRRDADSLLQWGSTWLVGRKALLVAPLLSDAKAKGPEKKTKGQKKARAPGSLPKRPPLLSLLQVLKEQGFQRVLIQKAPTSFEVLEIEEMDPNSPLPTQAQLYVVVDRLKVDTPPDSSLRARLLDAIEQALAIGQGRLGFYDLSTSAKDGWHLFDQRFACVSCGLEHRLPEPHLFSFNSPLGACSKCSGFGHTLDIDESLVVPDPSKTLKNGAIDPFSKPSLAEWQKDLFRFAERKGISIGKRYRELSASEKKLLWHGDPSDSTFPGILACFETLKRWKYKLHIRVFIRRYQNQTLCTECQGARLKPEALAVKLAGLSIADVLDSSIIRCLEWIRSVLLTPSERKIAQEVFSQVERRLLFLQEVGVGYLTLSRLAKTLSGGEFQRINLATQLGNGLCGTLYVLDEPSIGLHASDTQRLIRVLNQLRDQGNTVVIVEHDLQVMRSADWLLELGPAAGKRGGEIIAQGPAESLIQTPGSLTGKYLSGDFRITRDRPPRPPSKRKLTLQGCRENNLKDLHVDFPLNRLVVVTGPSGSGKSTLVHKTLYLALAQLLERSTESPGRFHRLYGAEQLGGIVLLDQSPIGKSSRSNPATYMKAWDEIRKIYAHQVLSLRRGYMPQHFSFNVDGGRCPICKGEGEITLDMHFMAEIQLPCEECGGKRYKKAILDVTYQGKNVDQLLHTTVDEAYGPFQDKLVLAKKLGLLRDVGLGYLQLGQSATTLSGGEAQRLKIAATLDEKPADNLLYVFDEPTTGLHSEDVGKLMGVIQDLIDAKQSVILIEHHLDVIAQADWVIDLGPGGGTAGGEIVAQGTPEQIMQCPGSLTGVELRAQGYQG
ncbi:MAG: excinuclease ABC subunit UvrA [Bdellovibrionia bacterium]